MEPAFLAHFHQAKHFRRKGIDFHRKGDQQASVSAMKTALDCFNLSAEKSAWLTREARELRTSIYRSLALAQEAAGDPESALKTCDEAVELRIHEFRYHAGMLQYRRAMTVWRQRQPEVAYRLFYNAYHRLLGARRHLPPGVSRATLEAHIDTIDGHLKLLRAAGFRNE